MTKTQTERFGQNQYSSGSDSFRRVDYNSDGTYIEARAAYDDGGTYTTLPGVGEIIKGRYVMYSSGGGTYRTLYRATDTNGAWEPALGNTIPRPVTVRPHAAGDFTASTAALLFTHPDLATPPGKITFDGQASFPRVTAYDPNDIARGSVYVGTNAAHDVTALGRMHVRTRQNGERGLMLQPHSVDAGNMLTVREAGGSDVVTVDASGYLRARSLSGFGGGAINAGAAVVAAPTSSSSDGVDIGLLLHGQTGATAKTILSVRRDLADTAPVLSVGRDSLQVGRLPWGDGSSGGGLALRGRQILQRALGYDLDPLLWRLNRASTATPEDGGLDETVASFSRASGLIRVPMTLTQALGTSGANLTLKHYTDLNSRFLELHRMSGETSEILSSWDTDGRLLLGARWKGIGVMRDARQSMVHISTYAGGGELNPGQTFSREWPTMYPRSATGYCLKIVATLETEVAAGLFSDREDGQQWFLNMDISIDGAAYQALGSVRMGGPAHRSGTRPIEVQNGTFWLKNIAAGTTFALRTRVFIGGAVPKVTVRQQWVSVEECVIADYGS